MISVVVPIYNAEKYLEECLDSIISQTYSDIEIILVNDGSKDSSGIICDKYANNDNRIKVLHIENGGANNARKIGVENAKGEYITFVDADDTLTANACELLISKVSLNTEIVTANYSHNISIKRSEVLSPIEYRFRMVRGDYPGPVAKLYKKSIFDDSIFEMGKDIVAGEDWLMGVRVAFNCKNNIILIPNIIYNYRQHSESTMHKFTSTPVYESKLYTLIRDSISKDELFTYLPALIENKLLFFRHIFCYRKVNPNDCWIESDFFRLLKGDIKLINYKINWLETNIFFKKMPSSFRNIFIVYWKIKKKLKR